MQTQLEKGQSYKYDSRDWCVCRSVSCRLLQCSLCCFHEKGTLDIQHKTATLSFLSHLLKVSVSRYQCVCLRCKSPVSSWPNTPILWTVLEYDVFWYHLVCHSATMIWVDFRACDWFQTIFAPLTRAAVFQFWKFLLTNLSLKCFSQLNEKQRRETEAGKLWGFHSKWYLKDDDVGLSIDLIGFTQSIYWSRMDLYTALCVTMKVHLLSFNAEVNLESKQYSFSTCQHDPLYQKS